MGAGGAGGAGVQFCRVCSGCRGIGVRMCRFGRVRGNEQGGRETCVRWINKK